MSKKSPPSRRAGNTPGDAKRLAGELAAAREALERSRTEQREMDEFISLLAHDLRTPLTSIRGYAQLLLRQGGVSDGNLEIHEGLQIVIQQADRLAALTGVLLDVSRIRLHRVALRHERVDVAAAIRRGVALLMQDQPNVTFTLHVPEPGLIVRADQARIHEIVCTLLSFAASRANNTPVEVWATTAAAGTREALVAVADSGPALAPELTAALFNQLVKPREGTTTFELAYPQLYIMRGIVNAHGGRVEAVSPVPGRDNGLRLSVWLP